uniref:EGF-like domain-containing protein n=1 Tax=Macrostomum lignano TaxID=282301 RepID=A0A1I8IXA7_9PLAT
QQFVAIAVEGVCPPELLTPVAIGNSSQSGYTETITQLNPGRLYATATASLQLSSGDSVLPVYWNASVTYGSGRTQAYLAQRLLADGLTVQVLAPTGSNGGRLSFQANALVAKTDAGGPDGCGVGFRVAPDGGHCVVGTSATACDRNECLELPEASLHQHGTRLPLRLPARPGWQLTGWQLIDAHLRRYRRVQRRRCGDQMLRRRSAVRQPARQLAGALKRCRCAEPALPAAGPALPEFPARIPQSPPTFGNPAVDSPRRTCAEFGHTCQAGCRDTESGSFECVCPAGYTVAMETGRCEDVNECQASPSPCPGDQQCLNTIGSYECRVIRCPVGYYYDARQSNADRVKFIVVNVLPKHPEFTMRIIDSHNANLRNCIYRLLDKSSDTPFDIRSTEGRVTIVRTTNDLAGKLGKMYDMKI